VLLLVLLQLPPPLPVLLLLFFTRVSCRATFFAELLLMLLQLLVLLLLLLLMLTCMFCRARFSALLPPSTLKRGVLPVMAVNSATTQPTRESMLQSTWYAPISCARTLALHQQQH
jgi:hypothetical protein